jgi:transglutaminase-like putative cysteine protease
MYYSITHLTQFEYSEPITDSVMEIRMQPRTGNGQRCVQFDLDISPSAKTLEYTDYLKNRVQIFDVPGRHERLAIRTESIVEIKPSLPLPDGLPDDAWQQIETAIRDRDLFDMLLPSKFAHVTPLLEQLTEEIHIDRAEDPIRLLCKLNKAIYDRFDYIQNVTAADSPIDIALEKRLGVCQDFAHIMIAICRDSGIPCRYVSGYLFQRTDEDRSAADATHAWVEAWLPGLGWTGFDPTNNLVCNEQHVTVAIGRDYADVPPTKGVFRGDATSKLTVEVKVADLDELPTIHETQAPEIILPQLNLLAAQQQQQQQ